MSDFPPPTDSTVKSLYGSAFRCAEPGCQRPLYRLDDETGDRILNSRVAHIHARRRNGPRWIDMEPEANRAASNLLLLCLEHSYEIDDPALESRYDADLLRGWKAEQLAEYDRLQQSWPINDAEVAQVVAASFSVTHVHASQRLDLARAVGRVVAASHRGRGLPARAVAEWRSAHDELNATTFVYDADGRRGTVDLPRYTAQAHRQQVLTALREATDLVAPEADQVRAEVTAARVEHPDLAPWLEHLEHSLGEVERAVGRWQVPPPFDDDDVLTASLGRLDEALELLSRRWRGDTTTEFPPESPEVVDAPESDFVRLLRLHNELLERARPHARVDHLPFDEELFLDVRDSLSFAVLLPDVMSFVGSGLTATAGIAAATLRNAHDDQWIEVIDQCASMEPLAAAVHLSRQLCIRANELERTALGDRAKAVAVARLVSADWADAHLWESNGSHMHGLLAMAASELGHLTIRDALAVALRDEPSLLIQVLSGCASTVETRDSQDWSCVTGFRQRYETACRTGSPLRRSCPPVQRSPTALRASTMSQEDLLLRSGGRTAPATARAEVAAAMPELLKRSGSMTAGQTFGQTNDDGPTRTRRLEQDSVAR